MNEVDAIHGDAAHIVVDRVSHLYRPPRRSPVLALQEVSLEIGFLENKIDVQKHADLSIVEEAAARTK